MNVVLVQKQGTCILIHKKSYHTAISCTLSSFFVGREPIKPLHLRFSSTLMENLCPNSDFVTALQHSLLQNFAAKNEHSISVYHNYHKFYDYKSAAKTLAVKTHVLLLNIDLASQANFLAKSIEP